MSTKTATEPKPEKKTKVKNPEAVAIDKLATILEPFDEASRRRIMQWANAVYFPPIIPAKEVPY